MMIPSSIIASMIISSCSQARAVYISCMHNVQVYCGSGSIPPLSGTTNLDAVFTPNLHPRLPLVQLQTPLSLRTLFDIRACLSLRTKSAPEPFRFLFYKRCLNRTKQECDVLCHPSRIPPLVYIIACILFLFQLKQQRFLGAKSPTFYND